MLAGLQAHLKTAPEPAWPSLLSHPLDWQQVLHLCQHHEVTPLVYESLSKHTDKVPTETLASFKQQVLKDKKKSLHLAQVLQELLALFERESIEVLPYKGVVLSRQLFGDIAKRPTKDLDLVVQKQDYVRTRDLLLAHGFAGPLTALRKLATPQQEKLLLESSHHLLFRRHGIKFELHFEMMPPGFYKPFTLPELWHGLDSNYYLEYPIKSMTYEQLLFALSTHAAIHYWKRLKWLFDSAKLLDQSPLSNELLRKAKTAQIETVLLANATLCHVLFALPLYETVQASLSAKPTLHKLCYRVLWQFKNWPPNVIRGFTDLQSRVWLRDSFNLVTFEAMIRHKFITGGHHFYSAPAFVYYFSRPVSLTAKYVRQFFSR
jgi:Uncharacterised nucleotidyltransferase